jgi:DNA-binding IscR family transcriptional regulator
MQKLDLYSQSHLIVAAIRVLEHQKKAPPSVEEICGVLSLSLEQGNRICVKLHEAGIIEVLKGPHGTRAYVTDHLRIEEIPKGDAGNSLQEEVQKFQNSKKDFKQKIEAFKAQKDKENKELFAQIEKNFKKKIKK